jgi:hypothetical protein
MMETMETMVLLRTTPLALAQAQALGMGMGAMWAMWVTRVYVGVTRRHC